MGDIPASFVGFRRYKVDYEARHFRYSETNQRVGQYTLELFAGWFPAPCARPPGSVSVHAERVHA